MAISLKNILIPEILQLFDAHELHIYIINGNFNIKYKNVTVFNAIDRYERFLAIILMVIKEYKHMDIITSQNEKMDHFVSILVVLNYVEVKFN